MDLVILSPASGHGQEAYLINLELAQPRQCVDYVPVRHPTLIFHHSFIGRL